MAFASLAMVLLISFKMLYLLGMHEHSTPGGTLYLFCTEFSIMFLDFKGPVPSLNLLRKLNHLHNKNFKVYALFL